MRSILRMGCLALALLGALLVCGVPSPAQDIDPFGGGNRAVKPPSQGDYITFESSVSPKEVRRGETFKLTITGQPGPGYHTYPITQRSNDNSQGFETQVESQLSKVIYRDAPGMKPLWPITETEPEWRTTPGVGATLELGHKFTWSQDIFVLPDATPGPHKLQFSLAFQVCDESHCFPPEKRDYDVTVQVSGAEPVALTPALKARLDAKEPPIKALSPPMGPAKNDFGAPSAPPAPGKQAEPPKKEEGTQQRAAAPSPPQPKDSSLWGLLLASIGAAIAMLFTPCVFPMIPITVSFFLKQSEKEHHKPLITAGVYSLTIIVVLALAVLVLGKLIVDLANNAWLNLGLGALLIFFALSLFGMYEIELPNFLARFTAAREGRGGYAGAFFMALTFTITSFTCTGPFLGPLLVTAKELQLTTERLVLASFSYSATFAAPFFVMALFPALLKKLPRSGSWLNSVKVVMGFLELAAALKFLGNTDVALNPGNARLFTFETVLCAWIALSAACGLYLFGLFRLPHDTPQESIGVLRMVLATIFIGLALYMVPALFRKVPQGIVGEGLYAFLPLDTSELSASGDGGGGGGVATAEGKLDWHLDYQSAWEQAIKEDKPIFIDFTGINCTNCRANENGVFPRKEVRDELAKFVRARLYTDSVPKPGLSSSEAVAEAERNSQLQRTFDDVSTPMYVVFYPDKTHPFDGDRLNGKVADPTRRTYSGLIRDPAEFVKFLKSGQSAEKEKDIVEQKAKEIKAALERAEAELKKDRDSR